MTTRSAVPPVGLCRCAECKIDLRGRFVFVDDETETLLGRSREDLFGKPITDVLDRSSQDVIDHILAVRNHYETHFDYAPLTLISRNGRQLPVDATISLCFNSGNPVNYQLILKPHSSQVRTAGDIETGHSVEEFVERCLAPEPTARYRQLAELLREFAAADQVAIYLVAGDHLEPRAGAGKDSDSPFVFGSLPEVTDLHQRVAVTDEAYAFTDTDNARMALDTDGVAPPEYVTRVSVEDDVCLLRFIFNPAVASDVQQQSVLRARLAKRLVGHLFNKRPDPTETDGRDINVQFTIGFLSSL
ncbi:MAG: PAS domain-containing protein, partial [candidate division Zixibacteria bacterium]|nr:PAS domain-containing protein [candidate division Zixibacteria bacterium]